MQPAPEPAVFFLNYLVAYLFNYKGDYKPKKINYD